MSPNSRVGRSNLPPPAFQGYILLATFQAAVLYKPTFYVIHNALFTVGAALAAAIIDSSLRRSEDTSQKVSRYFVSVIAIVGSMALCIFRLEEVIPKLEGVVLLGKIDLESNVFSFMKELVHGSALDVARFFAVLISSFISGVANISIYFSAPVRLIKVVVLWSCLLGNIPDPAPNTILVLVIRGGKPYSILILIVLTAEIVAVTMAPVLLHVFDRIRRKEVSNDSQPIIEDCTEIRKDVEDGKILPADQPDPVRLLDVTHLWGTQHIGMQETYQRHEDFIPPPPEIDFDKYPYPQDPFRTNQPSNDDIQPTQSSPARAIYQRQWYQNAFQSSVHTAPSSAKPSVLVSKTGHQTFMPSP